MIYRIRNWLVATLLLLRAPVDAATFFDIRASNGNQRARITLSFIGDPDYAFSHQSKRTVAPDIKQTGVIQGLPLLFNDNNLVKAIHSGTLKDAQTLRLVVDLTENGKTEAVKRQNSSYYTVVFTINADALPSPPPMVAKRIETPAVVAPHVSEPARNPLKTESNRTMGVISSDTVTRPAARAIVNTGDETIIAIDVGYSGQDPGAAGLGGTREEDVTTAIACKLRTLLNNDPIFKGVLARDEDYPTSVVKRSDMARKQNANFLTSIHADAAPNRSATGASVWVLSNRRASSEMVSWLEQYGKQSELLDGAGDMLANGRSDPYLSQAVLDLQFGHSQRVGYDVATGMINQLQHIGEIHKRQPEHASLGALRLPDIPSVLVETGFISSNSERRSLASDDCQQQLAEATYKGLRNYFLAHPMQSASQGATAQTAGTVTTPGRMLPDQGRLMPIQVLPPQLASQIAAGEVVERPASAVRELVENSLDAGATCIDTDIERGGAKFIRTRDNGCGIKKDELTLALARHAINKIVSLDDPEAIISLGLRGEVLMSISLVSRLTLTSHTAEQQETWQVYVGGRDMDVAVKPAAYPAGTTLEVLDLFYNTSAWRKFLRAEKTESNHTDEIIRRIALARFDVTINLLYNGKIVYQHRAVPKGGQKERCLGVVCGTVFLGQALAIEWQHGDLILRGWVADLNYTTPALAEIQCCYVNDRTMRDHLTNHVIRQVCKDKLGADQQPAFVLYLEIDPHQVGINVHPAKHEMRFHQSCPVYDLIYQGVPSVLQQQLETPLPLDDEPQPVPRVISENRVVTRRNHFVEPAAREPAAPRYSPAPVSGSRPTTSWSDAQPGYQKQQGEMYRRLLQTPAPMQKPKAPEPQEPILAANNQSFGRALTIVHSDHVLPKHDGNISLLSLSVAERWLRQAQLTPGEVSVCAQPPPIPLRLKVSGEEKSALEKVQSALAELGIGFQSDAQRVTTRAVSLPLCQQNSQILTPKLIGYLARQSAFEPGNIAQRIVRNPMSEHAQWSMAQAIILPADVERLRP